MRGKKLGIISRAALALLCSAAIFAGAAEASAPEQTASITEIRNMKLIPGGMPFGVKMYSEGVLVVGVDDIACSGRSESPAKDAGIMEKDVILSVDGITVTGAEDFSGIISSGGGKTVEIVLRRGGKELRVELTPKKSDEDGKYRVGMLIRDGTAGIGTVTYIHPDSGCFAGLGHGICDADSGKLIPLTRGAVVNVEISGVVKGKTGLPGELKGYFSSGKIGTLLGNTDCGVYGVFAKSPDGICSDSVPVGLSDEISVGEAEILCTTDGGGVGRYSVQISDIDRSGRNVKNFVVTVTDGALLEKTGGIVQGMSGSPIIQNGKLVGAVTHVLVSDPARGYGIFIENMLEAAE